ncbi:MAG: WhiB family transcriptional regulator [Acidimicrobiales bacterium]|jgi:WhiB family redox-sensing transcriptional regulator
MADAACKGQTDHFFAPHGEQAEARALREGIARAICVRCPVLLSCREYARRHREQGYWGAENEDQRLEARRRTVHGSGSGSGSILGPAPQRPGLAGSAPPLAAQG